MKENYSKNVEMIIDNIENNKLFSITDFTDYIKYATVKKILIRLEKKNKIIRLIDGIYFKPYHVKLTGELLYPSINEIAKFIAIKNNWNIVPTGLNCLNILGISDQMPAVYEFISDGPNRIYEILNNTIVFKQTVNKNIKNLSSKTAIIIQALKTIGKDKITHNDIEIIRSKINNDEMEIIFWESRNVTSWIFEIIKIMKEEGEKNEKIFKE